MAKRYHHGDLGPALLDAARALLDAGQPLTLRAVAREAGVSQAAPYRHFADKETLLAAVAQEGFVALGAALGAAPAGDPAEHLSALGVAYVRFAVEHRGWFRVMFGDAVDRQRFPACEAAADAAFRALAEAVRAVVAAGVLRGEVRDLTLVAWSVVHGLSNLLLDGQGRAAGLDPAHPERVAARVTQALLGALRPP